MAPGVQVCTGYWRGADFAGVFRTGDAGDWADGELVVKGRKDLQVAGDRLRDSLVTKYANCEAPLSWMRAVWKRTTGICEVCGNHHILPRRKLSHFLQKNDSRIYKEDRAAVIRAPRLRR